jgi:maltoporin
MSKAIKQVLTATAAAVMATAAVADDSFEYHGYWRLGFNTDAALNQPYSEQSTSGYTSRHTHAPNWMSLRLTKKWQDGSVFKVALDEGGPVTHEVGWNQFAQFKFRDAYLQTPISDKSSIWAGSRNIEFEDVRLFDVGNPFNTDGYGLGGQFDKTFVTLSFAKSTRSVNYSYTDTADNQTKNSSFDLDLKDVTLLARHEIDLGNGRMLAPMVKVTKYGSNKDAANFREVKPNETNINAQDVEGATSYRVGAVLNRGGEGYWGREILWYDATPVDVMDGSKGSDTTIGLWESAGYELGDYGVLLAAGIQSKSFKNGKQQFKAQDGLYVADGSKTSTSQIVYALGVQPIYYVTPRFHTALDVAYSGTDKVLSSSSANGFTVTPILRYAMNKSVTGAPEIYTSITYGQYAAKVKTGTDGKPTDQLITTQSGFEIWF